MKHQTLQNPQVVGSISLEYYSFPNQSPFSSLFLSAKVLIYLLLPCNVGLFNLKTGELDFLNIIWTNQVNFSLLDNHQRWMVYHQFYELL